MNEIFNISRFGRYLRADFNASIAKPAIIFFIIGLVFSLLYLPWSTFWWALGFAWDGRGVEIRSLIFFLYLWLCIIIIPTMSYGKVTNKKKGTDWLLVPASSFEKTVSMITLTLSCTVLSIGLYLGLDALICLIDPTCGARIFQGLFSIVYKEMSALEIVLIGFHILSMIILCTLFFLLGAIIFKRVKAILTFILGHLVTILLSAVYFIAILFFDSSNTLNEYIFDYFGVITSILSLILCAVIYLRVRTLKH